MGRIEGKKLAARKHRNDKRESFQFEVFSFQERE
jgi:hypothetical protein